MSAVNLHLVQMVPWLVIKFALIVQGAHMFFAFNNSKVYHMSRHHEAYV